jgi:hypothetical protein
MLASHRIRYPSNVKFYTQQNRSGKTSAKLEVALDREVGRIRSLLRCDGGSYKPAPNSKSCKSCPFLLPIFHGVIITVMFPPMNSKLNQKTSGVMILVSQLGLHLSHRSKSPEPGSRSENSEQRLRFLWPGEAAQEAMELPECTSARRQENGAVASGESKHPGTQEHTLESEQAPRECEEHASTFPTKATQLGFEDTKHGS